MSRIHFIRPAWALLASMLMAFPGHAQDGENRKIELGQTFGTSNQSEFLPVDEAFRPMVTVLDGNTLEISIQVEPGYYLYRDKIAASIDSDRVQAGNLNLPPGRLKTDQYFGEMEVYFADVVGTLPLARATPESMNLTLDLSYQGCAEGGICYMPVTRHMALSLPAAGAVSTLPQGAGDQPVSEQARLAGLISSANLWVITATFFGAGLLLAFTPCVLPMVPILSGLVAGEGRHVSAARGFLLALAYVAGMATIYTGAGVAAAAVGIQLQAVFNQPWVLSLFAALFVILALGMFGLIQLQVPSSLQNRLAAVSGRQRRGTVAGAFIMGALSSLIVTACVAPPLVATLTVISQTGDLARGATALFALSLGMGTPLLAVGASAGKLLPKAGPWTIAVRNAFGFMMLALAIWMLSRFLPATLTLALWGLLIFMAGVYLGGLTTLAPDATGPRRLGKGFGLLAVIYGAVLLLGSLAGNHSMLQPLSGIGFSNQTVEVKRGLEFQRVKTVADLDRALARAAAEGKTAMLDFYADWCVSCVEMEHYTFTDPAVQEALSSTVLLQADVTANDAADQALLKRFNVFGPPTIVFFDRDGLPRPGFEVVGYMNAERFAAHVESATARDVRTGAAVESGAMLQNSE